MQDIIMAAPSVEGAIMGWLDAKRRRSNSERTVRAYDDSLRSFQSFLAGHGLDLASAARPGGDKAIAAAAQRWAGLPGANGRAVAPSTFNHRLACVSSFYEYARRHDAISGMLHNPIEIVERAPVQEYANALPIEAEDIAARLAHIDRSTAKGRRDYAILAIGLYTGRRLSELAGLRCEDIDLDTHIVTFRRAKGGKVLRDELPPPLWAVLIDYMVVAGRSLQGPLWVSFARNGSSFGIDALRGICKAYLGTSKSHAIRHTAAKAMESVGMPVSDIQARLGHSSIQTTGLYLKALSSARNSHGKDLIAAFGIAPH